MAASNGVLLSDRDYVRLLVAMAPRLATRVWPELIEPLPFKVTRPALWAFEPNIAL